MYRTRLRLKKRTGYRGLVLLLLIGVLLHSAVPASAPEQVVWAEELVSWPPKRCSLAARRYWRRGLVLLVRRTKVLGCRVGLVAILLGFAVAALRHGMKTSADRVIKELKR